MRLKSKQKDEVSIRASGGLTTISVDKPTLSRLKTLAGEMPLSHYLRAIAYGYIEIPKGSRQHPSPGLEAAASLNTFEAVAAEVKEIRGQYNTLELGFSDLINYLMGSEYVWDKGIRRKVKGFFTPPVEEPEMVRAEE